MARDADDALAAEAGPAPRMLRRPADAPPSPGRVGDMGSVQAFRRAWATRREPTRTWRAWAGRVTGRSDRHLLFVLAQATDALATHCDILGDRLAAQETLTADVAGAFGEEIAQLRAEVLHLQRLAASLQGGHE